MSKLTTALIFVVIGSVLMFLTQISIEKTAQQEHLTNTRIFNYQGSLLRAYDTTGNYTLTNDITGLIPETSGSVSPTTGNTFTDFTTSIKTWFYNTGVGKGMTYLTAIANAPNSFIQYMGLAPEISFALGALWWIIIGFLIIAYILGKSD